jgi:hypothetical protein
MGEKKLGSPIQLVIIIFVSIAVFFAVAVWPFYNLIPEYVTEEVTVVSNSDGKCYVKTDDNFLIPAGNVCGDAKMNDRISVEYDVKIKSRMDAAIRQP